MRLSRNEFILDVHQNKNVNKLGMVTHISTGDAALGGEKFKITLGCKVRPYP